MSTDPNGVTTWDLSGAFSVGAATTVKFPPALDLGIVVLTNGEPIGAPEAIGSAARAPPSGSRLPDAGSLLSSR